MKVFRKLLNNVEENYVTIISISLIVLIILAVYWQDLSILFNEALNSEAVSYIVLIPLLASYLVYRKRDLVKGSLALERLRGKARIISVSDFVGVAICLAAFLVYWYGSYSFTPLEYHVVSLVIFIIGVTLILTSLKTLLILLFPIAFLVFLVPPPSSIISSAGGILASINTQGSYNLLKIVGLPVSLSEKFGAPIIALNTTPTPTEFGVFQASSGVYSLLTFTTFAIFLIYITRGSLAKRAFLFVLGFLILPVLNITRISIIVSAAYFFGQEVSDIFHAFSGWLLIFFGIFLLLIIGEKILHLQIYRSSKEVSPCSDCNNGFQSLGAFCSSCGKFLKTAQTRIPKRFWLKAFALLVGSYLLLVSISAPVFAVAQGLSLSNSPEENINAFPEVAGYRLQFLYRDSNYERIAGQDLSLVYAYLPPNSSKLPVYLLVGVATSIQNLHNWEDSLIAWQIGRGLPPLVDLLESSDVQITENPRIIARYLVFNHPSNYTYVAIYWFQRANFKFGLTVEPRYVRINLLYLATNPNDAPALKEELITIGQSVAAYWEPLQVQSLVSIGIPMTQFLLGSVVFAGVFIQTSQYALEQRKKRTNLKMFEKLASENEKALYQTLNDLSQKTKETTTENVASAFENATGSAVKTDELIKMLNNLQRHGIIKIDIININDQPLLVWKP
jgi:exosortase